MDISKENMECAMENKHSEKKLSSVVAKEVEKPLKIEFKVPAQYFTDAIPIGSGRLGALVWGCVQSETLNLNEDTLYTGVPGDYTNPEAPKALAEVRQLVDNGKYSEASTLATQKLVDDRPHAYQPLGDMKLEFDDFHSSYSKDSYSKELDLNTATARVKYLVGNIEFTREHFASYPDQVIVTKISASKPGSLSLTIYLDCQLEHSSYATVLNDKKYQVILEGNCDGRRRESIMNESLKGIQFCATLDLQTSTDNIGSVKVIDGKKLRVEGSDWVILRLVASSSFDGPFVNPLESKRDPRLECVKYLNSIENLSYEELYARHMVDYQTLFHRVSIELSKSDKLSGDKAKVSTAERVESFQTDEDPSLVELLFQFGRYLLISSSRPGTQPSNLQGIWNWKVVPTWQCAFTTNINFEMNYWPSLSCNLQECQEPLFHNMAFLAENGSKTARVNYEASGWVAHSYSDIWAKTSQDINGAEWCMWPMGGAWLCTHLWEHYMYTLDKDFLGNKAYPLLEGCTLFLLDWLIEGQGGYLKTNPSTSPEHIFIAPDGNQASVSYSSTMDMSIIREVFADIVSAAEVLGKNEDDLIKRVRKAQPRLLPTKIAPDGSIMEWAQDFKDHEEHHRHMSHLFGLFPGHMITIEKTADLCKAAEKTLFKRGKEGPGWSTAWKTALWARLQNSEHAYSMVKHLFHLAEPDQNASNLGWNGGLYPNLLAAHPPFQIDGNFGFSAAIAEMLVQSTMKDLILLPALPRDKWTHGFVRGLKARGDITLNLCWKEGDLHEVGIRSSNPNSLEKRLHYRGTTVDATILSGQIYTFDKQLKCVKMHSL